MLALILVLFAVAVCVALFLRRTNSGQEKLHVKDMTASELSATISGAVFKALFLMAMIGALLGAVATLLLGR